LSQRPERDRTADIARARERFANDPEYREHRRAYQRAYRAKHAERLAAIEREWRLENRERVNEKKRAWRAANPDRIREYTRLAANRRRGAPLNQSGRDYARVLYNDPCSYCGGRAGEIDHIEPLALGGGPDWDNLTAACRSCNAQKHSTPLLHYLLRRYNLEVVQPIAA
jgi:5-methylcytosine-specific restriction endonuclease McrA